MLPVGMMERGWRASALLPASPLDRITNIARTKRMTDDRHEAKQAVAAAFHQIRKEAKAKRKAQPQGAPMHHRANTDWWNYLPGGKKYR